MDESKKKRSKSDPSATQDDVEGYELQRNPKKKKPKLTEDEAATAKLSNDDGDEPKKKKKKRKGAEETDDTPGRKSESDDGKGKPKKKKVEIAEEPVFTRTPAPKDRKSDESDSISLYEDAVGTAPSYFGSNPMQEYRPPTLTGITELPVKDFFLMLLLWSPRFFVPWMSAWHEFNVFILARPDHLESKEKQLLTVEIIVFGVGCVVSILASIIADLASMRYYVYLFLLLIYTLCPIAGGYVDVVLRSRMYDKELYNHWFSSIILMRAAMVIPFIFFPVQFTCLFTEKANMSRQAHYNWTAFFAFCEFVNAYVVFWVIPGKCPTTEWTQIVVWVGILSLLYLLIVLTFTFSLIVKSLRYTLMTCLQKFGFNPDKYLSDEYNVKAFEDEIPKNLRLMKLKWFGLMLLPLVFSSFVFATLERFVPDEDWDKHYVLSATSMFYLGRILGAVVMVVVLFWIRHQFKKVLKIPIFRGDVLVLGLPHLFNILALLILAGRYATLSSLSPGDVILGPIPDNTKTVVMFFNLMFRNKTVCVRSDYFRPVKVRAFHYATREIYDPGVDKINCSLIPEPGANPVVATNFVLNHFKKNHLIIYSINLFSYLNKDDFQNETKYREYMNKPRVVKYDGTDEYRPQREPGIILINNFVPEGRQLVYLLKYGKPPTPADYTTLLNISHIQEQITFYRPELLGTWYIAVSFSPPSTISPPVPFEVREYTLYVAAAYTIGPLLTKSVELSLVRMKAFEIGQIAAPDGRVYPNKKVLQRDWAIQMGMTLAGMSAGGLFVGTVYLFWMDPPFPGWQTTSLAVFWAFMIGAAESPKVKLVDVGLIVSSVLLVLQIALTCLHVWASMNLYTPDFNFRKRPD